MNTKSICKKKLTKEEVVQFWSVVQNDYYFQMYYDDLPLWGFIGKVDKEGKIDPSEYKYYLYRHTYFDVLYNNDQVIEINVRTDVNALLDVTEDRDVEVEFLYSVKWKETTTPFEKRMEKFSQSSSTPHHLEIHWFSNLDHKLMYHRSSSDGIPGYNSNEGSNYDFVKYPKKFLFAACLGSGTQLFALTIFIFLLTLVGVFYPYNRGALFTALANALTSGITGYTDASFYC